MNVSVLKALEQKTFVKHWSWFLARVKCVGLCVRLPTSRDVWFSVQYSKQCTLLVYRGTYCLHLTCEIGWSSKSIQKFPSRHNLPAYGTNTSSLTLFRRVLFQGPLTPEILKKFLASYEIIRFIIVLIKARKNFDFLRSALFSPTPFP